MYKPHPSYNTVFETKHKESGTEYIGAILLYNETSTNINHKPFWNLCLIQKGIELNIRKFRWGSPSYNIIIDKYFVKPSTYEDMSLDEFIYKWIDLNGNKNTE